MKLRERRVTVLRKWAVQPLWRGPWMRVWITKEGRKALAEAKGAKK